MTQLKKCLLTGLPLTEDDWTNRDNFRIYWYLINVNSEEITVSICESLVNQLTRIESEISKILNENKTLLIGEFAKDDFKSLRGKTFHASCDTKGGPNHFRLKDFIDNIISKGDYPKNRKEKYDNLLRFLHQSQQFEGGEVSIRKTVDYYSKLYFQSYEELQFFLREMQRKELVEYNEVKDTIQFTFFGLEYFDTITKAEQLNIGTFTKPQYDIGLSFSGEDREYVEKVAEKLKYLGVSRAKTFINT